MGTHADFNLAQNGTARGMKNQQILIFEFQMIVSYHYKKVSQNKGNLDLTNFPLAKFNKVLVLRKTFYIWNGMNLHTVFSLFTFMFTRYDVLQTQPESSVNMRWINVTIILSLHARRWKKT